MTHIPHSTVSVPGAVDAARPSERAVSGPAVGPVRLRPPGGAGRIVAIDVVRGLAVLGMVAVHTVGALSPVVDAVVVGHTSVLFFLVAGVTVGLTASRRRADGAVEVTGRALLVPRAVVVFALGVVTIVTILPVHGLLLLVLAAVVDLRPRTLAISAVAAAAVTAPLGLLLGTARDAGTFDVLTSLAQGTVDVLVQAAAYLVASLAGAAVGRLLAQGALRVGVLAVVGASCAAAAYGVALLASVVDLGPLASSLLSAEAHSGSPVEMIGSTGLCLLLLAAVLALPSSTHRLLEPVAAVGALALTMYLLHFVVVLALLPLATTEAGQFAVFAASASVLVVVALLVRRRFRRGPLEWLVATGARRLAGG
ncbi:DUF418 domain-containing protein [uncultured Frigoribacterium sp.]|uniref:DUF418 domain-containing protein n=1 Tax=uncultured Frigoribacterium sp. TaxID=335377 RepID=UPI0028D240CD|nr:DUF418 domain-containing protein [uncultured Frigoribacterium sp.]